MKKPYSCRCLLLVSSLSALIGASSPGAPIVTAGSGDGLKDDLFDVSQFAFVLNNSPLLGCCGGSFAENALGSSGGVEGPYTLFADGAASGSIDFIDLQTASPIELTSYSAVLADDSDDPGNPGNPNRGSASFSLYASADSTFSAPVLISTTPLPSSYSTNFGTNAILISDTFAPATAQFFRIEITRTTAGGPRIREVDGFGTVVPEPGCGSLLAVGLAAACSRRRRSS